MRRMFMAWVIVLAFAVIGRAGDVTLKVDGERVVGHVDEKIYGHFLEHIYHSCNGGLWGEMVWSRSFEDPPDRAFAIEGDAIVRAAKKGTASLVMGVINWGDYEFSLEAQKIAGDEGFAVMVRESGRQTMCEVHFGAEGNIRHAIFNYTPPTRGQPEKRERQAATKGTIEAGKWYRVRVRCEGTKIEAFLDDQKVVELSDKRMRTAGRVGIAAFNSSAKFRNLKVTDLGGKTLFEGFPSNVANAGMGIGWKGYGKAAFEWSDQNPLNSRHCQGIAAEEGEAGVEQTPFCLESGEVYRGSVWARGDDSAAMVVRLKDGANVLAEAELGKPGAEWKEFGFELKPSAAAANATLQVGVKGKAKIWVDQVSLMSESARKEGGYRPDLLKAVAELKAPVIRWPGGSFASSYRWKDGIGPQHKRVGRVNLAWDERDVNSYGTDEYIAMCRKLGVEPLIVINVHSPKGETRAETIKYAQQWLEYCNGPATSPMGKWRAENGHPEPYKVKYWEIDNETWGMGAEVYAQAVKEFVPALKQIDPNITTILCGSGGLGEKGDREFPWNRVVVKEAAALGDYLSIHHYENPTRFDTGPAAFEKYLKLNAELIASSANPKMKLYVSEWNAQTTDWRTGLYCGALLNVFEKSEAMGMAGPALFLRHVSASAWDNAFINFDHRTWFAGANYVVMKLYREHYAPDRLAVSGDAGNLNINATRSGDGKWAYLKAVNPTDQPATVRLEIKGFAGAAGLKLVAPDDLMAHNSLEQRDTLKVIDGAIDRDGTAVRFTLPRWSVGVVKIAR